jgi:hypothetical protein
VCRWLAAHRRAHDRRPWQRAATAYRYLHEAIDVIASHAPDLAEVLTGGLRRGWVFVCLDGTLIAADRCRAKSESGHDIWYWPTPNPADSANATTGTKPADFSFYATLNPRSSSVDRG